MGILKVQVGDGVVFTHYMPPDAGPNIGGYLGLVYPGGTFLGVGFDRLQSLGTGCHQFAMDERAPSADGREPEYDSEWRRQFERFKFGLFMYGVGACTALEVLAFAREVICLESQSQQSEPGAAPDTRDM